MPSATGRGYYRVGLEAGTCECKDHEHRGVFCLHLYAVTIYAAKRSCRRARTASRPTERHHGAAPRRRDNSLGAGRGTDTPQRGTGKLDEYARQRAKNQDMYRAEAMTLDELKADNARLDGEREAAEAELAKTREASNRVEELEARKALILEWFGAGLSLGLAYLPPTLRRATYGMLGLRVGVEPSLDSDPSGQPRVSIEGILDAGVVRLSEDVEEFVAALEGAGNHPKDDVTIAARFEEVRQRIEAGEYGEAFVTEEQAWEDLDPGLGCPAGCGADTPGGSAPWRASRAPGSCRWPISRSASPS